MTQALYAFAVDSDRFASFEVNDVRDLDLFIDGFETSSMAEIWRAPAIRLSDAALRAGAPLPDFANVFGAVPALSARAVDVLGDRVGELGELLPLEFDQNAYWALNVTSVIDVMDEEKSTGDWFTPGRLLDLRHLVVSSSAPKRLPVIFKLPQWRTGRALVTEEFLDLVATHGLTGLAARPLTP